jgi:hypothetical protein
MGIASNIRASKYKLRTGSKRFTGEAGICNRQQAIAKGTYES